MLEETIRYEARYPPFADNEKDATKRRNVRATNLWGDKDFDRRVIPVSDIRNHVAKLDQDADDPGITCSVGLDSDGYLAFRSGGHLKPRMTVKFSSLRRRNRQNNKRALKSFIRKRATNPMVMHHWDRSEWCVVKQ